MFNVVDAPSLRTLKMDTSKPVDVSTTRMLTGEAKEDAGMRAKNETVEHDNSKPFDKGNIGGLNAGK